MRRTIAIGLALALALAGAAPQALAQAAAPAAAQATSESRAFTAWLDQQYEQELQMDPEGLTMQGRKDQYDKLTDRSEAQGDALLAWRRASVAEMKRRFDPAKLDEEGRTSFEVWALELQRAETSNRWRRHRYIFARGGAHTGLPNFLINFHRVDEPADMAAYIARVRQMDDALDQLLVRAKAAADGGVRMPQFAYDRSIDEVGRVTGGAPFAAGADSALLADGKAKIAALQKAGKIDQRQADAFTRELTEAMTAEMKPGYDRLLAWLKADRENTAPEAKGAHALPNGRDYYDAALFLQTTTDMTADQIHELGLSEVARLRAEMEAVKAKTGFKGSLEDFFVFMRTDRRFYLPNTDEGRAQYIAMADAYLAGMKKKLPEYFGILPKADLVVKRVEPFREEPGGAQHYFAGTPDGSRPGVFYAHLSDMSAMPTYQLENIAYHEGLPGHHMQISIAQELTGLPKFRTQYDYTAYSEGWGLYSEKLAKEMGFETDPYNDFGRLSGEIWRAIRLVVDTGMHAKGWSQEQAVAYFKANSAQPEAAIRSEIQRYLVNPGQATSYKVGMIRIQAMREEAKTALGDKFDIRAFHDVVLGGGALPLPVLEARVRRWVERTKAN
ncbi:DUF885 domain-containing protein [Phenylobacterium sp.]|jgi:uncharacterized protein (DUF885 family)|uniref:DUF885 domain-containing protein n=1 Tax=Phenylobacterium sp. TaxID=1871053 RepID=UPI002E31464C|nr:DUF885 domain-containing protein [Phenylobacterium sp.]HEX2559952.1 DUF885 domain-containing protein [Phenylobacterium sp.]